MLRVEVDVRELEFKCSKGKINTKGDFIEGGFNGVRCACCVPAVVVGKNRALRMLHEEFEYFRYKKRKDGLTGSLREVGVQSVYNTMPEFTRPEWEFSIVENEYWVWVLTHV